MRTLVNAAQAIIAIVIAAVSLAVMTAVGLAFVGVALIIGIGTAVAFKLFGARPVPVMARVRPEPGKGGHKPGEPRIWNDGRGTIIDM